MANGTPGIGARFLALAPTLRNGRFRMLVASDQETLIRRPRRLTHSHFYGTAHRNVARGSLLPALFTNVTVGEPHQGIEARRLACQGDSSETLGAHDRVCLAQIRRRGRDVHGAVLYRVAAR